MTHSQIYRSQRPETGNDGNKAREASRAMCTRLRVLVASLVAIMPFRWDR